MLNPQALFSFMKQGCLLIKWKVFVFLLRFVVLLVLIDMDMVGVFSSFEMI